MDLSVVVLSWNTAALTVRALRSVPAGARDLTTERICVDNASTDDSVERVQAEVPDVLLLRNARNVGFAAGNNRALPHLRGRYTCFLNSDAAASLGSLAHVVRWLDRHPRAAIAAPCLVGEDGRPQAVARPEPSPLGLLHRYTIFRFTPVGRRASRPWRRPPPGAGPRSVASVAGSCLVIRTDVFRALGGFDESYPFYWEDADLCRRARDAEWDVAWVPDGPPVVHAGGAATAAAGGPPRLAFVAGLLRYQRRRLGARTGRAYAALFALAVFVRALVDAPRLGTRGLAGRMRGREDAADKLRSASSWWRFLERDAGGLFRLLRVRG